MVLTKYRIPSTQPNFRREYIRAASLAVRELELQIKRDRESGSYDLKYIQEKANTEVDTLRKTQGINLECVTIEQIYEIEQKDEEEIKNSTPNAQQGLESLPENLFEKNYYRRAEYHKSRIEKEIVEMAIKNKSLDSIIFTGNRLIANLEEQGIYFQEGMNVETFHNLLYNYGHTNLIQKYQPKIKPKKVDMKEARTIQRPNNKKGKVPKISTLYKATKIAAVFSPISAFMRTFFKG